MSLNEKRIHDVATTARRAVGAEIARSSAISVTKGNVCEFGVKRRIESFDLLHLHDHSKTILVSSL